MRKFILTVLIVLFGLQTTLLAWWDTPHMIITHIAYENLSPKTRARIDELISLLSKEFPHSPEIYSAACWADDINNDGLKAFYAWHGKAYPYDPQNLLTESQKKEKVALLNINSVDTAINHSISTLKSKTATDWEKGLMLRFLIHCVGDIHQPLHCAKLYSNDFPNGDNGGLFFTITIPLEKNNLHSLWDSGFLEHTEQLARPLSPENKKLVIDIAETIKRNYPKKTVFTSNETNPGLWANESYQLAIEHAYKNIRLNESPSKEYLKDSKEICLRQIALAGYRLEKILKDIFEDN
jgi:hypothetical protein